MRPFSLRLVVVSSLLLAGIAVAATRPHYGGTLHIASHAALLALDPGDSSQTDNAVIAHISRLMFDTLVELDDSGTPQPALAVSWRAEPGNQRWQIVVKRGITFPDGAVLTSDVVAAALRTANPGWRVFPTGEAVMVELDSPDPNLPAELALPRNSVIRRERGQIAGTGPYFVSSWVPGKKLVLSARDDYWAGRAFVDSIEIDLGVGYREQMISLELGKEQAVEIAPDQSRRVIGGSRRIDRSTPLELMALVFARETPSADEGRLLKALALSIDRGQLNDVLLQGGGEPAGTVLPGWMTGYAFLFPTAQNLSGARQIINETLKPPSWLLTYEMSDPLARVIAERIVLNARDIGLNLQLSTTRIADLRLVRTTLASVDPGLAFARAAASLGLQPPRLAGNSPEALYSAESTLLESQRVIPLLHLSSAFGIGGTVRNWRLSRDGNWRLEDVWLGSEKP